MFHPCRPYVHGPEERTEDGSVFLLRSEEADVQNNGSQIRGKKPRV